MQKIVFYTLMVTLFLSLGSCGNSTAEQQRIREMQEREAFIRDSIAKVEEAEKEKKNAETIKNTKIFLMKDMMNLEI